MQASDFFKYPKATTHKHYEALRAYHLEGMSVAQVAQRFGYTLSSFYSLNRDFKKQLEQPESSQGFFVTAPRGRKPKDDTGKIEQLIIELRKQYLSVPDIKTVLDSLEQPVSESYIYTVIAQAGFARLPRRNQRERTETLATVKLRASASKMLTYQSETFSTQQSIGLLCLTPYIQHYGIDRLIAESTYPETSKCHRDRFLGEIFMLFLRLFHMV